MYILTRVNFAYEVETETYHNRTIGQALSYIQGKMEQYLNDFDASEMKELRRITRDFVTIAKNLKDHQSCIYRPEDNEPVAVEMWKPPTVSRFNKFITQLTETYPEPSHPYKLRIHPMESEADVELSINVDGRTVRVIIGFNTQLAFINHIALDTELACGQSHYRMRLPGTSTHVTVRSGRSDYSSAYMRDERPFEYGASDTQAMQFINQFITTMADLGM